MTKPQEEKGAAYQRGQRSWRITADLHTHTVYSRRGHAKGTMEENVLEARSKGLKRIGISDHGPDHIIFGVKEKNYFKMRQEIERLKQKYQDIDILLGMEANIINHSGRLAISGAQLEIFDYIMAGYHFGTAGESAGHSLGIHLMNAVCSFDHPKPQSAWGRRARAANTELALKAVEHNKLAVLTHPGCKGEIFVKEVAEACARRGTLMEINNSHVYLNPDQLREAAQTDVKFIIGSDAHVPQKVGGFERALAAAEEAGIDLERIVNLEAV